MELTLQEQLINLKSNIFTNAKENCNSKFENKITNKNIHSNDFKTSEVTMNKINYTNKKDIRRPQRRELWYVNLGNPQGSLQKGIRPCLVDSNDVNNKYSNIINVYPLTSSMTKARIPVHIEIYGFGLKEESIILIEQGVPIDIRYQLIGYIGTVDDIVMKKVDKAREIQHGDLKPKTLLERLDVSLQNKINKQLEEIKNCEKIIASTKTQSLIDLLLKERSDLLYELQIYCEDNNLNYRNFYVMYQKEEEMIAM